MKMGKIIDATSLFKSNKHKLNLGEDVSISVIRESNPQLFDILDFNEFDTIFELISCDPKDLRRIREFNEKLYGELLYFLDTNNFDSDNLIRNCPYNFANVMNYYSEYKKK